MPYITEEILWLILLQFNPFVNNNCDKADSPDIPTLYKIRQQIFDPWKANLRYLKDLCLVSKAFHRMVQPILYGTHVVKMATADYGFDTDYTSLQLFLASLLEKPSLGKMVKNVSINEWFIGDEYAESYKPPGDDILELYDEEVPMHSRSKSFLSSLKDGQPDEEIALLLALCPNVELFYFQPAWNMSDSCLMRTFGREWNLDIMPELVNEGFESTLNRVESMKRQKYLSKLKVLCLDACYRHLEKHIDFELIMPFMNLPQLRQISANCVVFEPWTRREAYGPFPSSNLSQLHLTLSEWKIQHLRSLLSACKNIESLGLQAGNEARDGLEVDIPAIGKMVCDLAQSVKRLLIDPRYWGRMFSLENGEEPSDLRPLGDLSALSRLEYLATPLPQLIGEEAVRSLTDYDDWTTNRESDRIGVDFEPSTGMTAAHKLLVPILPITIKEVAFLDKKATNSVVMSFRSQDFSVRHMVDESLGEFHPSHNQ